MANYIKATNFAVKDSLVTGDPNKTVKGTELDSEFNAIASAVTSKANSDSPSFTGTPTAPTATAGTNNTQVASTAFVLGERSTAATLTNKTLTNPAVSGLSLTDGSIVLEGATANDFETTLTVTDPTADRTITFPDKTGTVALTSDITNTALYASSGTYTIAGTTLTVSASSHGRSVGEVVYLDFTSGTAVNNYFTIDTVANANTFTVNYGASLTTSGNVTGYYSNKGLISIASTSEALAGTNADRAVTPLGLKTAVNTIVDSKFVRETAKATTSGTSIDFTGIPSWVKRITLMFNNMSTSGSSYKQIQLIYGGSTVVNSGYRASSARFNSTAIGEAASTTGFLIVSGSSSDDMWGSFTLTNFDGNTWVGFGGMTYSTGNLVSSGGITIGGTLTGIRLTTVNGTDTFDSGSINIMYE
jgi:hypothetical protein